MVAATATMSRPNVDTSGSRIHLVETYPHPRAKVWRAVTEPAVMKKWLMRPEGFEPKVGNKFKFVDDGPHKGWRGFVECEVLEVEHERRIRFTWEGDPGKVQVVTFTLEDANGGKGTRLTLDHEGFKGIGGFVLAKFIMGPGWKGMMKRRILAALDGDEIGCSH
jgi:uncharacterized protein YndB with AHSA1/START domain